MTINLETSKVAFVKGESSYSFQGIKYSEAVVASPLVEEGSGQGLGHPEVSRKFCAKKTLSEAIPVWRFEPDHVKSRLQAREVNSKLAKGDWVVRLLLDSGKYKTLLRWESEMEGVVISETTCSFKERTSTLRVKVDCLEVITTDAEKFRGFGKWRGNGGFLRNIEILDGEVILFNPNLPLREDGKLVQCEHVVGGEEYKTLTYVTSLLANKTTTGKAEWDAHIGQWRNANELENLIRREARTVTVRRWNIEDSVYAMFKTLYGKDNNFTFDDSCNQVVHKDVWCWVGEHVNIVEVPLTRTFMGRCSLFAEHIHYLGTELPELYKQLLKMMKGRQDMVRDALNMALQNQSLDKLLIIDAETVITEGPVGINYTTDEDTGESYIDSISVPGEFTENTFTQLQRGAEKCGFIGFLIVAEAGRQDKDEACVALNLDLFRRLSGNTASKAARSLLELFCALEVTLEDRCYDNWSGHFYRLARAIEGGLEILVADSSALLRKATKTPEVAFTCRVGGTIDASVARDELHICKDMATTWGLEAGDIAVPGRVPVPGMGCLKVVLNNHVPYGTVVIASATQHAIQEGDCDGDSVIFLAFSPEGKLRVPPQRGRAVNPIAD